MFRKAIFQMYKTLTKFQKLFEMWLLDDRRKANHLKLDTLVMNKPVNL